MSLLLFSKQEEFGRKIREAKLNQIKIKYDIYNSIINNTITYEMTQHEFYTSVYHKSRNDGIYVFNKTFSNHLQRYSNIELYEYYSDKYPIDSIEKINDVQLNKFKSFIIRNQFSTFFSLFRWISSFFVIAFIISCFIFDHFYMGTIMPLIYMLIYAASFCIFMSIDIKVTEKIFYIVMLVFLISFLFILSIIPIVVFLSIYYSTFLPISVYPIFLIIPVLSSWKIDELHEEELIKCLRFKLSNPVKYQFYKLVLY